MSKKSLAPIEYQSTAVSFEKKVASYEELLNHRNDVRRKIGQVKAQLRELALSYDVPEGAPIHQTTIYKKRNTETHEDVKMFVDSQYGTYFLDTAVDTDVMRLFNERWSGLGKFIEECHAYRDERKGRRKPEVDEEKTAEFREKAEKLQKEFETLVIEAEHSGNALQDVEKYVDMVDKIARIGSNVDKTQK